MTRAREILLLEARQLRFARAAQMLSGYLGCTVRPCPGRPGSVEATGLPGVHVLVGPPEEVAAEGRRALMGVWLSVLGRQTVGMREEEDTVR